MRSLAGMLEGKSRFSIVIIATIIAFAMGAIDLFVGPEVSTSILYVLPIAIAAWYGGHIAGHSIGALSAAIWLATDIGAGKEYAHPAIAVWNAFVRLAMFVVITHLVASHRKDFQTEERAADTDALTGLLNLRGLNESLENEILRARRFKRPFSLAYVDLDNFKAVNDRSGHAAGDSLLTTVANILQRELRKVDVVARVGGDEFVALLVETDDTRAEAAYAHAQRCLLDAMTQNDWPVTFSVGIVCFEAPPDNARHAISIADALMYEVKRKHKNSVICQTWSGAPKT